MSKTSDLVPENNAPADTGTVIDGDAPTMLPGSEAPFLTENQLAVRWHHSKRTLQRWRKAGKGPGYVVIGDRILYPAEGVSAFERRHWHSGGA